MSELISIAALVAIAIIVHRLGATQRAASKKNRLEAGSELPGAGYGLYSDDAEMDRLYTDLDDTEYSEDMLDD